MRKFLPLLIALLLTSCGYAIEVDDFADNWNKGEIDPTFLGKWLNASDKPQTRGLIINQGGMYRFIELDDKNKVDNDSGKTLRAGKYHFYLSRPQKHIHIVWAKSGLFDSIRDRE